MHVFANVIRRPINGDSPLSGRSIYGVVGPKVLYDVVLNEWVLRPAVYGDVRVTIVLELAAVGDYPEDNSSSFKTLGERCVPVASPLLPTLSSKHAFFVRPGNARNDLGSRNRWRIRETSLPKIPFTPVGVRCLRVWVVGPPCVEEAFVCSL